MRTILFVLSATLLLLSSAAAEQTRPLKFDQPADSKTLPVKQPRSDNSCAAYGAGFVKVDGTNTCVKIGGSISIGAGANVGRR
jgi:Porin subfamily